MKPERYFATMKEQECIAGDTLDEWVVEVTTTDEATGESSPADIAGCTMQLLLCRYKDDAVVLVKECTADPSAGTFAVTLESTDTAALSGLYAYHFELRCGSRSYKKIAGLLNVLPISTGGNS
ncbi:MAG: hypothetical protein E7511_03015 [Ruminococcus sp.]|nr:hypothetical protein [Ruminococcus sp.]